MDVPFGQKHRSHLINTGAILVLLFIFYTVGEVVLPFLIGLLLAGAANPLVKKIQKKIPDRNLAVGLLLLLATTVIIGSLFLFGKHIVRDFKRLNHAFVTFAESNKEELDSTAAEIKTFIENIYSSEKIRELQNKWIKKDSTAKSTPVSIGELLSGLTSFMEEDHKNKHSEKQNDFNGFIFFLMSISYFIMILFTYDYFEEKYRKYFGNLKEINPVMAVVLKDFNATFPVYFRQRTKVVLISMAIFVTAFLIMDIPGSVILGILAGILCYASHFHYIALIPLLLSCWVLSVEQPQSFFFFFGITSGVFVGVSILEETLFFPRLMKGVSTMNTAIMAFSFFLWTYVFGSVTGTLIALPMTSLLLIYLDRLLTYKKKQKMKTKLEDPGPETMEN